MNTLAPQTSKADATSSWPQIASPFENLISLTSGGQTTDVVAGIVTCADTNV